MGLVAASLFSITLAGAALAGNPQPAEVSEVTVALPQAISWSGLYAGGQVSTSSGIGSLYENGILNPSISGTFSGEQLGVFAGYNFEVGSFVLGGEVAYSKGPIAFDASPAFHLDNLFDLKLRVGKPIGSALLYGVAGRSFGAYTRNTFETLSSSGMNYGAGVDFQVSDRIFVGVEYLVRGMLSEASTVNLVPTTTYGQVAKTIQFRVGMRF